MDPTAAVQRLQELSQAIDGEADPLYVAAYAEEMASVWDGLDEWMRKGGFPPNQWVFAQQAYVTHRGKKG